MLAQSAITAEPTGTDERAPPIRAVDVEQRARSAGDDAGSTTTGEPEPSAEGLPSSTPDDPEPVRNPGECYAATVAQASALGARAEALLRDSEGLIEAHDVFVAVVDNVPSARDTCAAVRLDAAAVSLEVSVENLATSAERVAELQAATR